MRTVQQSGDATGVMAKKNHETKRSSFRPHAAKDWQPATPFCACFRLSPAFRCLRVLRRRVIGAAPYYTIGGTVRRNGRITMGMMAWRRFYWRNLAIYDRI